MTYEVQLSAEFSKWPEGLNDLRAAARVAARIERLSYGHIGDVKLFDGIGELRIDYGPGLPSVFLPQRRQAPYPYMWWHKAHTVEGY